MVSLTRTDTNSFWPVLVILMLNVTESEGWAKEGSASFSMLMFAAAFSSRVSSSLSFLPSSVVALTLALLIRVSGSSSSIRATRLISLVSPGLSGPGSCQSRVRVPFSFSREMSGSGPLSTNVPAIPLESWSVILMLVIVILLTFYTKNLSTQDFEYPSFL